MYLLLKRFLLYSPVNRILTRTLRPASPLLPDKLKIPAQGFFRLKISRRNTFLIEAHYTSLVSRLLFWDGITGFEYGSVRVMMELLKKSRGFVDIGANIGYYSLLACRLNPEIRVLAFEPFPDSADAMMRNINRNGFDRITLVREALSDRSGSTDFFYKVHPDFPKETFQLAGDNSLINFKQDERKTIPVKISTLDDYLQRHPGQQVDLMKIDTETTEHLILKGAKETIRRHRPIILCEVLRNFHEETLEQIFSKLRYRYFKVQPGGLAVADNIRSMSEAKSDFFFAPEEKAGHLMEFVLPHGQETAEKSGS